MQNNTEDIKRQAALDLLRKKRIWLLRVTATLLLLTLLFPPTTSSSHWPASPFTSIFSLTSHEPVNVFFWSAIFAAISLISTVLWELFGLEANVGETRNISKLVVAILVTTLFIGGFEKGYRSLGEMASAISTIESDVSEIHAKLVE